MCLCLVIVLSQPEMSVQDARSREATDRNSIFWILVTGGLIQVSAVLEWAYIRDIPAIDPPVGNPGSPGNSRGPCGESLVHSHSGSVFHLHSTVPA